MALFMHMRVLCLFLSVVCLVDGFRLFLSHMTGNLLLFATCGAGDRK